MSDHLKHGAENKGVASFEALSGITLTPLFLIGLTRRYLRTA